MKLKEIFKYDKTETYKVGDLPVWLIDFDLLTSCLNEEEIKQTLVALEKWPDKIKFVSLNTILQQQNISNYLSIKDHSIDIYNGLIQWSGLKQWPGRNQRIDETRTLSDIVYNEINNYSKK